MLRQVEHGFFSNGILRLRISPGIVRREALHPSTSTWGPELGRMQAGPAATICINKDRVNL